MNSETSLESKRIEDLEKTEKSSGLDVPDGGKEAWLVVAACWLLTFSTWGANSGFSIYLAYYIHNDVFAGATRLDYGAIGGLTFGTGILFSCFINYFIGITNLRTSIAIGCVLQLASTLLASFSTKLWQLYLTQGVMQGVGRAFIAVANLNILPQWFHKKRNLVMGICASGSGAGGIVFNLAMQRIVDQYSYNWALRAQGIICASLVAFSIFFAKSRANYIRPVVKVYDAQVYQSFGIWVEALFCVFSMFGYVILLFTLTDFTRSLGYTGKEGSIVSTMVHVGSLVFRPLVGHYADKAGPVNLGIVVHAICGVFALAMWIPTRNFATAIVFALIEGSMMGTVWVIVAPITARIVGLRKMGIGMALMWGFLGASGIVSPFIGISLKKGETTDPTQYVPTAIFVGLSFLAASLTLIVLRGWLLARDLETADSHDEDEDFHLGIQVSFSSGLKNCFSKDFRRI